MVHASPAWPPHAILADVMCLISSKSAPFASDSGDSPKSALISIEAAFMNRSESAYQLSLLLKNPLQPLLLRLQQMDRLGNGDFDESHLFARSQLTHAVEVCRDYIRDLWIAAGGLLIDKENNRLLVLRDLNCPERNSFCEQLRSNSRRNRFALQTQTGAIRLLADGIWAREKFAKGFNAKPVVLCTTRDAKRLARI